MKKLMMLFVLVLFAFAVSFSSVEAQGLTAKASISVSRNHTTPTKKKKIIKPAAKVVTPTPSKTVTPTATKVARKNDWSGQFGFDLKSFPSVGAGTLPMGFQFLNTKSAEPEFFLHVKYKYIALETLLNLGGQDITMDVYGSSLDTIHVYTPVALALKCYPLDGISDSWSIYPFFGIRAEYTKVKGSFSMGGFKFDTSGGDNFTPAIPIGIEFGKTLRGFLYYEVRMVNLDTVLPGVGTLEFQQNGNWVFGTSINF